MLGCRETLVGQNCQQRTHLMNKQMPNIFNDLSGILNEEKERLDRIIGKKQDKVNPIISQNPLIVAGATLLGLGASRLLLGENVEQRQVFSDHPLCGIPTGGQVETLFID